MGHALQARPSLKPPQSTPVSNPFLTPSVHFGARPGGDRCSGENIGVRCDNRAVCAVAARCAGQMSIRRDPGTQTTWAKLACRWICTPPIRRCRSALRRAGPGALGGVSAGGGGGEQVKRQRGA